MEKSEQLIKLFVELMGLPNTEKTFKQMVYGRHLPSPSDGWRKVFDEEKKIQITLEKNPSNYFVNDGQVVFPAAGEGKKLEEICIKFDKLPDVKII